VKGSRGSRGSRGSIGSNARQHAAKLKPKTQHPTPKTQDPTPKTQHPKPKTQHPKPNTFLMAYTIPEGTRIGHVHLKVADLERSLNFYRDILGFELQQYYGDNAAFISAGGYHHHIGLNTWYTKNGEPPSLHSTGLFHTAILYPERKDLAVALKRIVTVGYPITGASDHGVSQAIYLNDPDMNGVELYWDRPKEEWPKDKEGNLQMVTEPLDLEDLLKLAM
jgi:catechol 2,3-dioxygenase